MVEEVINNKQKNQRIAKNYVFLVIRQFVVLFITLYTTRMVLKNLGVVDYGIYNVVCGFVMMFSFLNTSMTNGIQRFYNYELGRGGEGQINKVYNTSLRIQSIMAISLFLIAELLGLWYIKEKMVIPQDRYIAALWIYQSALLSFILLMIQVPYSAIIMANERMNVYSLIGIFDAVLKLIIAITIGYFTEERLIYYGWLIAFVSFFNFIVYFLYAKKNFVEVYWTRSFDKLMFKKMISFSGWNLFGSFSGVMKEQGINLIINLFFGPSVNAARGVAHQVNAGVKGLVANLSIAVRPQVIQSYASGDVKRTMNLTYSISKISIGVLYLVALPIVLEIDYILHIWLGNNIPYYSALFVRIIILISFINSLNSAVSGVIHASGKMMTYQVVCSLVSLLCLPTSYILLNNGYGPQYAFWMTLCFAALSHVVSLLILKTIIDYSIWEYVKYIIIPFLYYVLLSSLIPIFVHYQMEEGFIRLCIVFLVSLLIVGIIFYLILLNKKERELIHSFFLQYKKNHL